MKKYRVTIDTPKGFKGAEFENFDNAVRYAVKAKEIAFREGRHWTISLLEGYKVVAQITT